MAVRRARTEFEAPNLFGQGASGNSRVSETAVTGEPDRRLLRSSDVFHLIQVSTVARGFHVVAVDEPQGGGVDAVARSEEHTSELQSLMRISYAVFCLKKKKVNHIVYQYNKQA